jgi:WD40 repeat protein
MASLFISHSSSDQAAAEQIVERLAAEGFAALFLDFDPAYGIPAGRDWKRELFAELRKADGVIFMASAASVASQWCITEVGLAQSLGKPVFPLRLEAGVRLGPINDVQWIDLSEGETAFARLLVGLRRAGLDPADSFAWDPTRSPYPGLESFSSDDAAVFFGRDQEITRLLELLQPTLQRGAGRFVAVVGPSGSGKSSLLRAGLLPRLKRLPTGWVVLPAMLPGQHPTRNLAHSLVRTFASYGSPRSPAEVATFLDHGPDEFVGLAVELAELGANGDGEPSVLVVVDQAEELLTRSGLREQQAFLGLLDKALDADSPLWVVATMRSEFLSSAPDRAGLAEVVDDPLVIEPLSRGRLPEVIQGPAQRAGLEFAPGLVERMVEETTGGDALPLLAYTLRELYQQAGPDGRVTMADYEAVGGVVGALQQRAGQVAEELDRRGQGRLVMPTLLQLAAVEGDSEPTRRRVLRIALSANTQPVVDAFVDARLLTTAKNPEGQATVEVAHEALLRRWQPLREAIEASRTSLRLRSELERAAADWDKGQRDESYLLRGGRLDAIGQWAQEHPRDLVGVEQEFLEASQALAKRDLQAVRRSRRRAVLAATLAILLALALASTTVAIAQQSQLQAQRRLASSAQLAAEANRLVDTQPDTAILAGLQSLSIARDSKAEPPSGLVTGLAHVTHASQPLTGHTGPVNGVALSRNGRLAATASGDRSARLWDVATGQPHGDPLTGHTGGVLGVAFSPNGRLLATASQDGTARLWDVATGQPHGDPMTGHTGGVLGVAFSPNGRLLATASQDGTARLWDVATGQPHGQQLTGHTGGVLGVAFSPNGRLLATANQDGTARLWDVATGQPHGQPLTGHTDRINAVAFGQKGRLLATASDDRTVRLWDMSGQPYGQPLVGQTDRVNAVAFSPDDQFVISGSTDQTARLWEVTETYSISQPLVGHTERVNAVAFSPDGQLLATGSDDKTVRLWDVATGQPHGRPLIGSLDGVTRVAFSPTGELLAAASEDQTVRLWDVATGQQVGAPLTGHTDRVNAVAFSPDGKVLATASDDQTVRLWDVATGHPHGRPLTGHTDRVNAVAFSPEGLLLASGSEDQTVRLWDIPSGHPHGEALTDHTAGVLGLAFSPDARLLASASADRTVSISDVASGKPYGQALSKRTAAIFDVAFTPDGRLLATASEDQAVRLSDVVTGQPVGTALTGHAAAVTGVAVTPDGTTLATASADGTARLWNPRFTSWLSSGCHLVGRNLSQAEWDSIASGLPYERTCPELPSGQGAPPDAPAAHYG